MQVCWCLCLLRFWFSCSTSIVFCSGRTCSSFAVPCAIDAIWLISTLYTFVTYRHMFASIFHHYFTHHHLPMHTHIHNQCAHSLTLPPPSHLLQVLDAGQAAEARVPTQSPDVVPERRVLPFRVATSGHPGAPLLGPRYAAAGPDL